MEDSLPEHGEGKEGADQLLHLWQEEEALERKNTSTLDVAEIEIRINLTIVEIQNANLKRVGLFDENKERNIFKYLCSKWQTL